MKPELRHRLALLLVGVAAALVGLSVATWVRRDDCLDAGGRWLAASRTCELAGGPAAAMPSWRAVALGAGAGLLAAVVLWRTYTFFVGRAARRRA